MLFTLINIYFLNLLFSTTDIDFSDIKFGSEKSLEIVTWNIEHFPKNDQKTVQYVVDIVKKLDVDIIAIQEITDISKFQQLLSHLENYDGYIESDWFGGLAFLYKKDTIEINDSYEIFQDPQYWTYFPRYPMVLDINFKGNRVIVINNHLKCCGDNYLDMGNDEDEEYRRYMAIKFLKEYIDLNFSDINTIVVGDLNDEITDIYDNNVFKDILDDSENYLFADKYIAIGDCSNFSFPTYPSHLDHIIINKKLFDKYQYSITKVIKVDSFFQNGWREYENNISDHRPVGFKIFFNTDLMIDRDKINERIKKLIKKEIPFFQKIRNRDKIIRFRDTSKLQ